MEICTLFQICLAFGLILLVIGVAVFNIVDGNE